MNTATAKPVGKKETEYNGWKNRQTWNVSLWINNDYGLYMGAVEYIKRRREQGKKGSYRGLIAYLGLNYDKTPDGINYVSTRLDYAALNEMVNEL